MSDDPVYCALCDEPATWMLEWTRVGGKPGEPAEQPVCDEHLADARAAMPALGVGCWSMTRLAVPAGSWPAYWARSMREALSG